MTENERNQVELERRTYDLLARRETEFTEREKASADADRIAQKFREVMEGDRASHTAYFNFDDRMNRLLLENLGNLGFPTGMPLERVEDFVVWGKLILTRLPLTDVEGNISGVFYVSGAERDIVLANFGIKYDSAV